MSEDLAAGLRLIADGLETVARGFRLMSASFETSNPQCGDLPYGRSDRYPCIRSVDHTGNHRDYEGDEF